MEILKCECPLLLGKVNEMVGCYLSATRNHGDLVSRSIVIVTAKALIKRNPQFNLDLVALETAGQKV